MHVCKHTQLGTRARICTCMHTRARAHAHACSCAHTHSHRRTSGQMCCMARRNFECARPRAPRSLHACAQMDAQKHLTCRISKAGLQGTCVYTCVLTRKFDTHACARSRTCTNARKHTDKRTHVCTHTRSCVRAHDHTLARMLARTHARTYACTHVRMHARMHACTYACTTVQHA